MNTLTRPAPKPKLPASIILATYEMPRHLEMVLAALEEQSVKDFEVILCDDGSGEATREIVNATKSRGIFRIEHVWQENVGFRKCRILNEGIRVSSGGVLIFLDGDCVPHRDYVRGHLESQEKGRYCAGRRLDLGQQISETLTVRDVKNGFFNGITWRLVQSSRGEGGTQHLNRALHVTSPFIRRLLKMDQIDDLIGCNFSVLREDLFAINGFDEDYEGYGREDTDVELRLQNLGLTIKSVKGIALQYHVWHPRRAFTPKNDDRLERLKIDGRIRCQNGIIRE